MTNKKVNFIKSIKLNSFKKFIVPVLALIILTCFVFRDMAQMIVQGEGFIWLIKSTHDNFWQSIPSSLANFEVSAVLVGTILINLFGINLQWYYLTWLLVMIVINILLFFTVYTLTKNILVSFSAALIFAVNYIAQWGLIGWTYTSFLERMITVIFLIPSFLFLHRYLEKEKLGDFLLTILLFFVGIGLGQWGLIFAGAYIFYPLCWLFFRNKTKQEFIRKIAVSISFLIICVFFLQLHYINQSGVGPRYSFTYFLQHPEKFQYAQQLPLQLSRMSQYPVLLNGITLNGIIHRDQFFKGSPIGYLSDIKEGQNITKLVILFYFIETLLIYFRLPAFRPLLFTIIFGMFSIFLINIYFGRYMPEEQPGPSRYLYLPTIWFSIFWALFIWAVFWQKKGLLFIFGYLILLGYFLINFWLIFLSFQAWMYSPNATYLGTKALFKYIQKIEPFIKPNTLIITTWDEMGCGEDTFLNEQIGKGKVAFWPDANNCAPPGGWEGIASKSAQVIKLRYDKQCQCVIEEKIK